MRPELRRRPATRFLPSSALLGLVLAAGPGAAAPAPAPASAPAPTAPAEPFRIGGWCVQEAWRDPGRLEAFAAAGLDYVVAADLLDPAATRGLVTRLDSLRAHRPGFDLQAVLAWGWPRGAAGSFTANPRPFADRAALARTLGPAGGFVGPSVLGWLVWDEPCDSASIAAAGSLARWLRAQPATAAGVPLVNLLPLPEPAAPSCLGAREGAPRLAGYRAYLDATLDALDDGTGPPPVLSFDLYPFQDPARTGTTWFENLALARDAARAHSRPGRRVPVWPVVQLSPYRPPGGRERAVPRIVHTRWQAWTALAYGVRGISYWTVGWAGNPERGESFAGGLVDSSGRRGARFADVRDLDRELHAIGSTLNRLDPVAVAHVDPGPWRLLPEDRWEGAGPELAHVLAAVEGSGRADALVGLFRDAPGGEAWLLVVNRSLDRRRRFTLRLATPARAIERIERTTGRAVAVASDGRSIDTGTLPAATGDLYRLVGVTLPAD